MAQPSRRTAVLMTLVFVFAIVFTFKGNAQNTLDDTFTIKISLVKPTVHAGEVPVLEEITENKTNHVVYAGWAEGGRLVEIINEKGEDISLHILGNERKDTGIYLRPSAESLEPGYHQQSRLPVRTGQEVLAPGVYKLRIHRLDFKIGDAKSRTEIYSNSVTLTVVP
jgi:hypothetical protein